MIRNISNEYTGPCFVAFEIDLTFHDILVYNQDQESGAVRDLYATRALSRERQTTYEGDQAHCGH